MLIHATLVCCILVLVLFSLRLLYILPANRPHLPARRRGVQTHILVVLGSGGHTAEMFALLRNLDPYLYNRRSYVVSSGDAFSAIRAQEFENQLSSDFNGSRRKGANPLGPPGSTTGSYAIYTVPRARLIHQSLFTTPLSACVSLWACIRLLAALTTHAYPDLILTNGPGTGVIVVVASYILRFFDIRNANSDGKMRTIYIESWARVKTLSLSGILLLRLVDRFLVQWEALNQTGSGKAEYHGVLI
jgi:beta-1,4-N-acetylglucosaminyltransferase